MSTGFPMDTVDLAQRPTRGVSAAVLAVLDSIFYSGARTRPSLEVLLSLPLFANVEMPDLAPLARTRLGARAKEALRECRRLAPAGGGEVSKPPRLAARPHRYADTPLAVAKTGSTVATTVTAAAAAPRAVSAAPVAPVAPVASNPPPVAPVAPKKAAATSSAPAPPPPPAPSAPAAPPPPPPPVVSSAGRGGLLSSIQGFKGGLKKVVTVDKSKPVFNKK
jgi:hypothetical protein